MKTISNEEKATEFANYFAGETDYKESAAYSAAMKMHEWDKEQFIEWTAEWLNAHHFDYRGLIEKGLALTAPDGMYNI